MLLLFKMNATLITIIIIIIIIIKGIKNVPSALLSYISMREFLTI